MKKFMVLYMANAADFEKMMKESTPEQQQKGMQGWIKWMGDNQPSLVDGGAPLGKTKRDRRQRRVRHKERDRRLFDRASRKLRKPRQSCSARIIRISRCRAAGSKSSKSCIFPGCERDADSLPALSRVDHV